MTAICDPKGFEQARPVAARRHRGRRAFLSGEAAEQRVAQDYERRGFVATARRWRGSRGEIDLVMRDGAALVFVEVKQSGSFASAASHLSEAQMRRIYGAAEEFIGNEPNGSLTELRFDVALVDGTGQIEIHENAFGFF
ncbi:MAG: hypothetical protein CSA70_05695 [Rhodobacterales bacterium]|nr:MAG: hypothetical protein CSA70_05695 [Rhodobacterales bacterium]